MLKKAITYKDLDGKEVTEDFYFHLSKAELAEMELSEKDGMAEKLKQIIASDDRSEIIRIFKWILRKTIGKRSEDGKQFIKSEDYANWFMQTDAFSELFMELLGDATSAAVFINAVVPVEVSEKLADKMTAQIETVQLPATEYKPTDLRPETRVSTFDDFTDDQILQMSDAEFKQLLNGIKGNNVPKRVLILKEHRNRMTD